MLINDIETFLTTYAPLQGGSPPVTFTLRRGFIPAEPDAVIALVESEGMKPVRGMGASQGAPIFERPMLEVHVRGPRGDYIAGREAAELVYQKLDHCSTTQSGRRYFIEAWSAPFCDGQDKNDRWLFVTTFLVHKERG